MNDSRIYINNDWQFFDVFDEKMISSSFRKSGEVVRIPHSICETPFNNFDDKTFSRISAYKKIFKTQKSWKGKKIFLTFEAVAHRAEVFLNGVLVGSHNCGYTAFSFDVTEYLKSSGNENILVVKVDSRSSLNQPPFGYVVDYMTYGGIYRDVYLEVKNPAFIKDVFVKTKKNSFETEIQLSCHVPGSMIEQRVEEIDSGDVLCQIDTGVSGETVLTSAVCRAVQQWSLEKPSLYYLVTELIDEKGKVLDCKKIRFGFRDIRFDESGFYLNGIKIKLRGLNRHQSYPYVGYAMPKSIQYYDAEILKNELGLNYVRTCHYPQSQHFIDRCDEIGLLVFTEIPGWQFIGDRQWQDVAVENTRDMVLQYRNHPSIFMWGVRINESADNDEFYARTNSIARKLDSTRPTGGVRCIKNSSLLEDVYTFNDFIHNGKNEGIQDKIKVTSSRKGYLVTEYNGHMFPTKTFDCESRRTELFLRHATVLNSVASKSDCAGSSGWCAFDYNTQRDFGSGDGICYHGVMDMFRNPKLAASVYKIQGDICDVGDVLEVSSMMNIGEYNACVQDELWISTNADEVKVYVNNEYVSSVKISDSPFGSLKCGPCPVTDLIGNRLLSEDCVSEKTSSKIKKILESARKHGMGGLSFSEKIDLFLMNVSGSLKKNQMDYLYKKYVSNWGVQSLEYKFEAVRDGKVVKTLLLTHGGEAHVDCRCNRVSLVEDETYDVCEVHLRAVDENGVLQSFCQEAVTVECEGSVELVGPRAVSLKGGMAGFYVRTKGKSGKGLARITDWKNNVTTMDFTVKVNKLNLK